MMPSQVVTIVDISDPDTQSQPRYDRPVRLTVLNNQGETETYFIRDNTTAVEELKIRKMSIPEHLYSASKYINLIKRAKEQGRNQVRIKYIEYGRIVTEIDNL